VQKCKKALLYSSQMESNLHLHYMSSLWQEYHQLDFTLTSFCSQTYDFAERCEVWELLHDLFQPLVG